MAIALAIGWLLASDCCSRRALLLAWFFQRNPLIANPSLPLLGWLLVLHAFVPSRPYGSLAGTRAGADHSWRLPDTCTRRLDRAGSRLQSLGCTKLFSPRGWTAKPSTGAGESACARSRLRDLVLALPPILLK